MRDEKETYIVGSQWIPGSYEIRDGVKGGRSFKGWGSDGAWHDLRNGMEKIIVPSEHRMICSDNEKKLYTVNVTQAAHRNGVRKWTYRDGLDFVFNGLVNGIKLFLSGDKAFITDESFKENLNDSQFSADFTIDDLQNSKNNDEFLDYK